jgi:hypothetical protein
MPACTISFIAIAIAIAIANVHSLPPLESPIGARITA